MCQNGWIDGGEKVVEGDDEVLGGEG